MNAINQKFMIGLVMLIGFSAVLAVIFSPVFKGQNGLDYLDGLFNSIAKGSAYYIPELMDKSGKFQGETVDLTLSLADEKQAQETAKLFQAGGATVDISGSTLKIHGDLGEILKNSLSDTEVMYRNRGAEVSEKYGYNDRLALLNWWKAFKEADKDLTRQKKFKEAKMIDTVNKKAVETSYNYYGIEPQSIVSKAGIVVASLLFYVIYTVWYGYAILFLFEGNGLKFGH